MTAEDQLILDHLNAIADGFDPRTGLRASPGEHANCLLDFLLTTTQEHEVRGITENWVISPNLGQQSARVRERS